jgi:hypothetical protein
VTGMVEQLAKLLDTLAVWLVAHDTAAALAAGGAGVAASRCGGGSEHSSTRGCGVTRRP